jgi:hypothetical protein
MGKLNLDFEMGCEVTGIIPLHFSSHTNNVMVLESVQKMFVSFSQSVVDEDSQRLSAIAIISISCHSMPVPVCSYVIGFGESIFGQGISQMRIYIDRLVLLVPMPTYLKTF